MAQSAIFACFRMVEGLLKVLRLRYSESIVFATRLPYDYY